MNNGVKLNKVGFVVTECTVSNAKSQSFGIWNSSPTDTATCLNSPVDFKVENMAGVAASISDALHGYSYRGFQFINEAPNGQIVTCKVIVCHEDDTDSICVTGCYA